MAALVAHHLGHIHADEIQRHGLPVRVEVNSGRRVEDRLKVWRALDQLVLGPRPSTFPTTGFPHDPILLTDLFECVSRVKVRLLVKHEQLPALDQCEL